MGLPVGLPVTLAVTLVGATVLSACDTNDGKTLRPADPNATTTSIDGASTDASSIDASSTDVGTLISIPLQADVPSGDGVLPGDAPVESATNEADPEAFELYAPWVDGAALDRRYTCDGDDISPALSWTSPPAGTSQLAFSLVDESAFSGDRPFTHWVLAGVDPTDISLLEAVSPPGAVQGENSFGETGWSGPCPPIGDAPHIYRLTMYALNQQVELADGTTAIELLDYIETVAIGSTDITATYQR